MRQIPLTHSKYAIVDDEDYGRLNHYRWYAALSHNKKYYYAVRNKTVALCKRKKIYMHREILNAPKDKQIDHINNNALDNQKSNLRVCTRGQNQHNQKIQRCGKSQYKGVVQSRTAGRWQAQIKYNRKGIYLGTFTSEIGAANAYDTKARELFGAFAHTNF